MSLGCEIVKQLLGEADELDPSQFVDDFFKTSSPYQARPREVEDERILRKLKVLGKYYLILWDTYAKGERGRTSYLGYRFVAPGGKILFQGTDLGVSGDWAIDSDDVVNQLLSFFVLQPGETDDEYFENYTEDQMDFVNSTDAETIRMEVDPEMGGSPSDLYVDLEERE